HAIQFSILVLIALLFLFESLNKNQILFSRYIHILLIIFFTAFLVLLSSKLIIAFYLVYVLYFFISFLWNKTKTRWVIASFIVIFFSAAAILFLTNNPVSRRFNEIKE